MSSRELTYWIALADLEAEEASQQQDDDDRTEG